jgi:paraquat-inducible protein A
MSSLPSQPEPTPGGPVEAGAPAPIVTTSQSVPPAAPPPPPRAPHGSLIASYPWHVHVPVLFLGAAVALAFGLTMPVMRVEKAIFWETDYTLITGAQGLWEKGERFLAAVLLLFSGVFPVIKLLLLGAMLILPMRPGPRARLVDLTDAVGRWSMLDVFVVALFIVLARSALIATAAPAPGLYVFCGAIIASMLLSLELRRLSNRLAREQRAGGL